MNDEELFRLGEEMGKKMTDEEKAVYLKETIYLFKKVENELEEHFDMPKTQLGAILSIADRIDNLVGSFGIGNKPTGSKDPYKLKRDADAVIRIIMWFELDLDLKKLIIESKELHGDLIKIDPVQPIMDFFKERLKAYYINRDRLFSNMDEVIKTKKVEES